MILKKKIFLPVRENPLSNKRNANMKSENPQILHKWQYFFFTTLIQFYETNLNKGRCINFVMQKKKTARLTECVGWRWGEEVELFNSHVTMALFEFLLLTKTKNGSSFFLKFDWNFWQIWNNFCNNSSLLSYLFFEE